MTNDQKKPVGTIWNATATPDPLLKRLDMSAPASDRASARERASELRQQVERDLAAYVSRSTSDSLKKVVK